MPDWIPVNLNRPLNFAETILRDVKQRARTSGNLGKMEYRPTVPSCPQRRKPRTVFERLGLHIETAEVDAEDGPK